MVTLRFGYARYVLPDVRVTVILLRSAVILPFYTAGYRLVVGLVTVIHWLGYILVVHYLTGSPRTRTPLRLRLPQFLFHTHYITAAALPVTLPVTGCTLRFRMRLQLRLLQLLFYCVPTVYGSLFTGYSVLRFLRVYGFAGCAFCVPLYAVAVTLHGSYAFTALHVAHVAAFGLLPASCYRLTGCYTTHAFAFLPHTAFTFVAFTARLVHLAVVGLLPRFCVAGCGLQRFTLDAHMRSAFDCPAYLRFGSLRLAVTVWFADFVLVG